MYSSADLVVSSNKYVWSSHEGAVFLRIEGHLRQLEHVHEASALAYEPLAQMLYWANKRNRVSQPSCNGTPHIDIGNVTVMQWAMNIWSLDDFTLYWFCQFIQSAWIFVLAWNKTCKLNSKFSLVLNFNLNRNYKSCSNIVPNLLLFFSFRSCVVLYPVETQSKYFKDG